MATKKSQNEAFLLGGQIHRVSALFSSRPPAGAGCQWSLGPCVHRRICTAAGLSAALNYEAGRCATRCGTRPHFVAASQQLLWFDTFKLSFKFLADVNYVCTVTKMSEKQYYFLL